MPDPQRYTKHLDTLLALVANLALTTGPRLNRGRTISGLTNDLGLIKPDMAATRTEIQSTLDEFPGLFRKTMVSTSGRGENFYMLHLRRALAPDPNQDPPALSFDVVKMLLEFVSQRAEAEADERQFHENLTTTQDQFEKNVKITARNSNIAVVAAIIAAILAAVATIVAAVIGH